MKKDIMSILPQVPLHDIIKTISQTNQLILPVIDDNNKYLACINWSQLRLFLEEQSGGLIIAHDVMVKVPQIGPDNQPVAGFDASNQKRCPGDPGGGGRQIGGVDRQ